MFVKKNKIDKIKLFQVKENQAYILSDETLRVFDSQMCMIYEKSINAPFGGEFNNDEHIFLWEKNQIFDIKSESYISSLVDSCLYFNTKEIVSILYSDDYTQSQICLYDFLNASFIWKTDLSQNNDMFPFFCDGDKIIAHTKNNKRTLSIINYFTGTSLWIFHLSDIGRWYNEFDKKWEEGKAFHVVGVINDILWVDVTAHVLLGIDIHTGQIKYNLKEANPMNEFPEKFTVYKPHYGKTTYDQEHHKLWGMEGYSYWEVDLNEAILNLKLWYMGDECESHFTSLPNFDICGINQDYIFFPMGGLGGNRKAQVAALNRKTMKIDWQYLFMSDTPYYTPTKVEVSEDNLFVLDSDGTLNIFEKEKVA